jgi:16S rRNA processing protein RimM
MPSWISVGRILRAHGLKGELVVKVADPRDSALLRAKTLKLGDEPKPRKIVKAYAAHESVLLTVEGAADRTAAEGLRLKEVFVDRADFPATEEGEFYFSDLVGLAAVDEQNQPLGTLEEVWETGPVPVLVVRRGTAGSKSKPEDELLLPFAERFVVKVDLAAKRIVIRVPEYAEAGSAKDADKDADAEPKAGES